MEVSNLWKVGTEMVAENRAETKIRLEKYREVVRAMGHDCSSHKQVVETLDRTGAFVEVVIWIPIEAIEPVLIPVEKIAM